MLGGIILSKKTVDDYIEQGIYGKKEINPEERRQFLGTLRERVVIALSTSQVREKYILPQVEKEMRSNQKAVVYLNGNVDYSYLSKYIQLAQKHKLSYTVVTNKEYNSKVGLVLAYDHAIDREEIYITETGEQFKVNEKEKGNKSKVSFWKKFLG